VTGIVDRMQHSGIHKFWPQMMNPFSETLKHLAIAPILLPVKRRSDITRALTLFTFSSVLDLATSSRTRFVFHSHTAIQKYFTPSKILCPRTRMLSTSPF
jgi:hypothetical protein